MLGGLDFGVYLIVLVRATTREKIVKLFEEKSAPQTKSWLRLWHIRCGDHTVTIRRGQLILNRKMSSVVV